MKIYHYSIALLLSLVIVSPAINALVLDRTTSAIESLKQNPQGFFYTSCVLKKDNILSKGVITLIISNSTIFMFQTDGSPTLIGDGEFSNIYKRGYLIEGMGRIVQEKVNELFETLSKEPFRYHFNDDSSFNYNKIFVSNKICE